MSTLIIAFTAGLGSWYILPMMLPFLKEPVYGSSWITWTMVATFGIVISALRLKSE